MTRLNAIAYIPLDRALLCECGLIGNAPQCACGNKLGLLQLSKVLDRVQESPTVATQATKLPLPASEASGVRISAQGASERSGWGICR